MHCNLCGQEITPEILKAKARRRMERISDALRARAAAGLPVGRKRKVDKEEVVRLLTIGMSLREIARELKCSVGAVQYALNALTREEAIKIYIRNEDVARINRGCDLGDSVGVRAYMYPHRDDAPNVTAFLFADSHTLALEKERDRLLSDNAAAANNALDHLNEISRLREALEPFANFVPCRERKHKATDTVYAANTDGKMRELTFGDFDRAKACFAQAVERPTMRQDLRSLLVKVYEASADGEGIESCCGGKHFKTTLMAGDRIYRLSYADAKEFDTNSAVNSMEEK